MWGNNPNGDCRLAGVATQISQAPSDSPRLGAFPMCLDGPPFSLNESHAGEVADEAPQAQAVPEFSDSETTALQGTAVPQLFQQFMQKKGIVMPTFGGNGAASQVQGTPVNMFTQFMQKTATGFGLTPPGGDATARVGESAPTTQVTLGAPGGSSVPAARNTAPPSVQPAPADFEWFPTESMVAADTLGRRISL